MLKKAGILVAAAAAGVLAISPLAFAGDTGHDEKGKGHHESSQVEEETTVENVNVETDNQTNDCEFDQSGSDVDQTVVGGSSLLGLAGLATGIAAPVTTQAQLLNCNNIDVSDLFDIDSNNTDETTTSTEVDDSFNTED